jgi:acetyl esterase/lipase
MLIVGGADGFFDEDLRYATELTRAGVPTEVRVYAGAPHGFDLVAPESAVSAEAAAEADRWLERIFAGP